MLSEKLHHLSDDIPVLFQSFCEDEDIIKVYHHYSFGDQFLENPIHHGLEGSRTIGQSEEHDKRFIKSPISPKSHFPLISIFHPDVIEAPADIKLRKIPCSLQFVDEFGDKG